MTKHDTQLEYTVHPDSLFYASSADGYALANSASHPSTFTLRLKRVLAKLMQSQAPKNAVTKRRKFDRYERD
jgi:hypothetical protein